MRKIYFILIICITSFLWATEINQYEEILVHSFNIGYADGEIDLIEGPYENSPSGIWITKNNEFIIIDLIDSKIDIFYNNNFITNIEDIWGFVNNTRFYDTDHFLYSYSYMNQNVTALNRTNNKLKELTFPNNISNKNMNIITKNVIFNYFENGEICSYVLLDPVNMLYSKLLNEQDTLDLFIDPENNGLKDYTIDSKKRIFNNGNIQNRDYHTLYNYWKELRQDENVIHDYEIPQVPPFKELNNIDGRFGRFDLDHNSYWLLGGYIVIFDSFGNVIDYFKYNNYTNKILGPAIDLNGNIFYISKDKLNGKTVLNLYKIARLW